MTTIKDIAARLGVSISTVSKGLNGANDISEELRQTVLDTAVEMGYSAKHSRKVENRKLCVLVENMNYELADDFGYDIVLGFKQNAFKHKWDVDIIPISPNLQTQERYDTYILKKGCQGAFLMGLSLHDEWMQQLKQTNTPTVLLDNYIEKNPNVGYIGTDNYEGIDLAIRHLCSLGHKKIGFINGSLHSLVNIQRQEAFEIAMRNAGLTVYPELLGHGYHIPETAQYYVSSFISAGATAILCGSDAIAKGVIDQCRINGFNVPNDISIIGFDDINLASSLAPSLTTIRQERNDLGQCAYVILNSLVNHIPISRTLLRPQLIERDSTTHISTKYATD